MGRAWCVRSERQDRLEEARDHGSHLGPVDLAVGAVFDARVGNLGGRDDIARGDVVGADHAREAPKLPMQQTVTILI